MNKIKLMIEIRFEILGRYIFRKKWCFLIVSVLLTILFASQLPKINFDASTVGFFHKDDPTRMTYEAFQEQFGRDEVVVILVSPPDLYDLSFLRKLKAFHEELEEKTPHLDEVKSLINITSTWGKKNELIVEKLMEDFPENELLLKEKIIRIRETPLYNNLIILLVRSVAFSEPDDNSGNELEEFDAKTDDSNMHVAITDRENSEFIQAIYKTAEKYNAKDFPIEIAGSPVIIGTVKHHIQTDTPRFTAGCFIAISILLLLIFRRISGVVYPLIVVVFSMASTLGIMAFFSTPITGITQILPGFILVVGVCDSVHILAIFYSRIDKKQSKEDAIAFTFRHSGLAIMMTSLTTAGSLISFIPAKILPITDLGIYAPVGVLLALFFTFFLLPALLAVTPIKTKNIRNETAKESLIDRVLLAMGRLSIRYPQRVIFVTLILVFIAIVGITKLNFSHNHLAWFPDDEPVKVATQKIDEAMNGTVTAEFIIDTKKENGLHEPEIMKNLAMINQVAEKYRKDDLFVGKSFSLAGTLKNTHKALNENRMEFYAIPGDKKLIAQELLLFENGGTDDLERLVDSQFSKARITMKFPWKDANRYVDVLNELEAEVKHIIGDQAEVTKTILLIGSLKNGLVVMFPNFLPIMLGIGLMGYLGFRMDMSSILCGSLAIGLVVDDTIHFMHTYQRYYHQSGSVSYSVEQTLLTTGRALLVTTMVLTTGFLVYRMAFMKNIQIMGTICAFIVVMAFLADIMLVPAIMKIITHEKAITVKKVDIQMPNSLKRR
ncbi:MAG: MMPL family transporter [Deltaproteobacteria bacterium]|nr:MMPL family transporter [Deltaproteobacteria bacterium]